MTPSVRWLDFAVVFAYLMGMTALGLRFSRRQTTTENYFVARRSVPSWAMGMSMLATMVSSVTFVAYPGSSYAGDWSLMVPGFMLIAVLPFVGKIIIPFYREVIGMSAYEYFERRFGRPARFYSAFAFSLAHFSKMGFVLYLMALTISSITGWNIVVVIVAVAAVLILYAMKGGIEAIVWTDVIQGFVMGASILIVLGFLLFLPEGGPAAVLGRAADANKFRLGVPEWSLGKNSVLVLLLYGLFWYLQRYVADQTMVQRYLLAKTDEGAFKGVRVGAFLSVPVWAMFMLIGTCVWGYFQVTGEGIPASITKADQMFPYFLSQHLPPGVLGLLLACLSGSAMTMLASDLNSMSVVAVEDFYRFFRPHSTDRERLVAAKTFVVLKGILNIGTALLLVQSKGSALASWFAVSAIASGGLMGLFFLAFLTKRAHRIGVYCGIVANLCFSVWAALTKGTAPLLDLGAWNFPYDELLIGVIGNVLLFAVGLTVSYLLPAEKVAPSAAPSQTIWNWLASRRLAKVA
ncbi:MAG TPA: sodium/solute symporter [Bryobacteraceae bacterium]|nr:sodium/solute symporter [Bryobacteraceae bacterium]